MNEVTKFFEDNINILQNAQRDPLAWNLNQGLYALCQQLDRIESNQHDLDRRLNQIEFSLRSR